MRTVKVGKGERTRVLHLFSDSMPQTVRFTAEPVSGDGPVSGQVEVAGSHWLFPKPVVTHDLAAENALPKGMWDTRYSIYVTPDQDTKVTFQTRHFTAGLLAVVVGVAIAAAVGSVLMMTALRGGS